MDKKPPSELETLALQAENLTDTEGPTTGQDAETEQPKKPKLTNAQVIAGTIAAGREVFCRVTELTSPKIHLTDEIAAELGECWGAVCEKHGFQLSEHLGKWEVEITAVVATAMIGMSLYKAVNEEIRARNAKPVQAEEVEAQPAHHGV